VHYRATPYPDIRSASLVAGSGLATPALQLASSPDFALTSLLSPGLATIDPFGGLQPISALPLQQAGAALALPRTAIAVQPGTQLVQAADMTPSLSGQPQLAHLQVSAAPGIPTSLGVLTALPSNIPKTETVSDTSLKPAIAVTSSATATAGLVYFVVFSSTRLYFLWLCAIRFNCGSIDLFQRIYKFWSSYA